MRCLNRRLEDVTAVVIAVPGHLHEGLTAVDGSEPFQVFVAVLLRNLLAADLVLSRLCRRSRPCRLATCTKAFGPSTPMLSLIRSIEPPSPGSPRIIRGCDRRR